MRRINPKLAILAAAGAAICAGAAGVYATAGIRSSPSAERPAATPTATATMASAQLASCTDDACDTVATAEPELTCEEANACADGSAGPPCAPEASSCASPIRRFACPATPDGDCALPCPAASEQPEMWVTPGAEPLIACAFPVCPTGIPPADGTPAAAIPSIAPLCPPACVDGTPVLECGYPFPCAAPAHTGAAAGCPVGCAPVPAIATVTASGPMVALNDCPSPPCVAPGIPPAGAATPEAANPPICVAPPPACNPATEPGSPGEDVEPQLVVPACPAPLPPDCAISSDGAVSCPTPGASGAGSGSSAAGSPGVIEPAHPQ